MGFDALGTVMTLNMQSAANSNQVSQKNFQPHDPNALFARREVGGKSGSVSTLKGCESIPKILAGLVNVPTEQSTSLNNSKVVVTTISPRKSETITAKPNDKHTLPS